MGYRGEQKIKGKIYVYDAVAIWDPEKQRSKQKRTYIGTKNPDTGEFIPNSKYYELYGGTPEKKSNTSDLKVVSSVDFGNIYLLSRIAETIGLSDVLKQVFPGSWQEILTCAWYSLCEQKALYLCEQWKETVAMCSGLSLTSPRISELLKSLNEEKRLEFYRKWAALRTEKEYLALDITSISSYSELIEYVEYGYNRDKENLPQINLAMLFGEQSRLPVFCRIYPGSIKDVSTLVGMFSFMKELHITHMHYVMDKGFYSDKGLQPLLEKRTKFSIGVPFSATLAKEAVKNAADHICSPANAIEVNGQLLYCKTTTAILHERRIYIHVYFDETRHVTERTAFMQKILKTEAGLREGSVKPTDAVASKYFTTRNSKNGLIIHRNEEAINKEIALNGYFVILSNDSKNAEYILNIYRTKDVVEKSFDNLKNGLDLKRLNIHSDAAMQGRIFIGFIALIMTSYIRNAMKENGLYKKYTFASLLGEMKKLKCIHFSNGTNQLTELTSKQKVLYEIFDFKEPSATSI